MQKEDQHIEKLLPRYCEGTLGKGEEELVREWIASSEKNRRIVKQIHTLFLATETSNIRKRINTERALDSVSSRISTSKTKKRGFFIWTQRIAATLFIPLLVAYSIQLAKHDITPSQILEVKTNPGMTTSVALPDGSTAFLNSETTLSYPSQFTGNTREVKIEGEVFFMIKKDPKRRFIVTTPHQSGVEVLGTHFNIEAYKDEDFISTTLVEGKIRFYYTKDGSSKSIILAPGEKLINTVTTKEVQIIKTTGETETSWKDGKIIFSNTPMTDALHMLEKRYNVQFTVMNKKLLENSFTGTFTHQRLEHILEYFQISSQINWKYLNMGDINKEKSEIEIY